MAMMNRLGMIGGYLAISALYALPVCALPEEAPGCHPTAEERQAEQDERAQVAARDGRKSNMERRYSRERARGDDDVAIRDRDSNMERRYERERGEELRNDEPIDETLHWSHEREHP